MREKSEIFTHIDHTLLTQTATTKEIKAICDEAVAAGAASVCIPPAYVRFCSEYLEGKIPVCTVIGFPNGYCTAEIKAYEAKQAVDRGAREIDMVINVGALKDGRISDVEEEIRLVRSSVMGLTLKVIIETCFLTKEEIKLMCEIVNRCGADYIKTSTGFGSGGATFDDVALMADCLKDSKVKIKASGGIRTLEDADKYLDLGANRIGASAIIKNNL